jgi:hypothetical protein
MTEQQPPPPPPPPPPQPLPRHPLQYQSAEPPQPSPAARLRVLRIIWAALLMGQLMFLVVAMTFGRASQPGDQTLLFYIAAGMLVMITPLAYLLRAQTYASGRQADGSISGSAYATGNILFWAMFEGVGMFSIVGVMLNGGRGPHLFVTAVALAMQIVNFPTGRPMRPDDSAKH